MKTIILIVLLLFTNLAIADTSHYSTLFEEAERFAANGQLEEAITTFKQAKKHVSTEDELHLCEFRILDLSWRSSWKNNPTSADIAIQSLRKFSYSSNDRASSLAAESLGDYYWTRSMHRANWSMAIRGYEKALRWIARADQTPHGKTRYLAILRKMAFPTWAQEGYVYGNYSNWITVAVLKDALSFELSPIEKAEVSYLIARTMSFQNVEEGSAVIEKYFKDALAVRTKIYSSALFDYAQWLDRTGEKGNREKAKKYYRQLVNEFPHSQFARSSRALQ